MDPQICRKMCFSSRLRPGTCLPHLLNAEAHEIRLPGWHMLTHVSVLGPSLSLSLTRT